MTLVKLKGAWRLCCGYEYQRWRRSSLKGQCELGRVFNCAVTAGRIASCRSRFAADNSERC